MTLPKVLIFGQPFNKYTGGGITLSNLFAGWDLDKIAVLCTGHELNNLDLNVCNTYYQLGEKENKWIFPFRYLQRKFSSGLVNFDSDKKMTVSKSGFRKTLISFFFYPLLRYLGCFHFISTIRLSKELCQWLGTYKPDILYVQVTQRDAILFAQKLCSYLKIPMIIHIMDDWPSTISDKGVFKKYWHRKIDSEFKTLLGNATICMSISDDMADEYRHRYGKDFTTFHNPIDIQFWKKNQRVVYDLNAIPTVLYAGRVGVGIEKSLELIAKSVQQVNEDLGTTLKFILQTREKPRWSDKYKCVEHRPLVPYDDLPKMFSEADFLMLPYDFSKESVRYIKYSMPTKFPEYMISGTPIILFAPEITTIVRYAKKYECAEIVTKSNYLDLTEAIKSLLHNKENRQKIAQNAIKIAENNHESKCIREKFKNLVCSLPGK